MRTFNPFLISLVSYMGAGSYRENARVSNAPNGAPAGGRRPLASDAVLRYTLGHGVLLLVVRQRAGLRRQGRGEGRAPRLLPALRVGHARLQELPALRPGHPQPVQGAR